MDRFLLGCLLGGMLEYSVYSLAKHLSSLKENSDHNRKLQAALEFYNNKFRPFAPFVGFVLLVVLILVMGFLSGSDGLYSSSRFLGDNIIRFGLGIIAGFVVVRPILRVTAGEQVPGMHWNTSVFLVIAGFALVFPYAESYMEKAEFVKAFQVELRLSKSQARLQQDFSEKRSIYGEGAIEKIHALERSIHRERDYIREIEYLVLSKRLPPVTPDIGTMAGDDEYSIRINSLAEYEKDLSILQTIYSHVISPVGRCAEFASRNYADLEAIRSAIRMFARKFHVFLDLDRHQDNFENEVNSLLAEQEIALDKLQHLDLPTRDPSLCLKKDLDLDKILHYTNTSSIEKLRIFPQFRLADAYFQVYLGNFQAAVKTLERIDRKYENDFNAQYFEAFLYYFLRRDVSEIVKRLDNVITQASIKANLVTKATTYAGSDDDAESLRKFLRPFEIQRAKALNGYVFTIAVEMAERNQAALGWWRDANAYAKELEKVIADDLLADPRPAIDTIQFFKIVQESAKDRPNRDKIEKAVSELKQIERSLVHDRKTLNATDRRFLDSEVATVRSHIALGEGLLK